MTPAAAGLRYGRAPFLSDPSGMVIAMPLSPRDRDTLRLAVTPFRCRGELENVIRDRFNESPTRFWQRVNALLSDPAAVESDPIAVRVLVARRDRAIAQRTRVRVA